VKIRSWSWLASSAWTPRHSIERTVGPGAAGAGAWFGSGTCARAFAVHTSAASAVASRQARMARSLSSRRVPVIAAGSAGRKFRMRRGEQRTRATAAQRFALSPSGSRGARGNRLQLVFGPKVDLPET
jgi:hypothetical protein